MGAKAFQYPQDVPWVMRDKRKIRLGDMTDSHLANAIRMLRRKIEKLWDEMGAGYSYIGGNPDSMGTYYAHIAADQAGDEAGYWSRVEEAMMDELRRRYPNVRIHVCGDDERLPRLRF